MVRIDLNHNVQAPTNLLHTKWVKILSYSLDQLVVRALNFAISVSELRGQEPFPPRRHQQLRMEEEEEELLPVTNGNTIYSVLLQTCTNLRSTYLTCLKSFRELNQQFLQVWDRSEMQLLLLKGLFILLQILSFLLLPTRLVQYLQQQQRLKIWWLV